MEFLRQQLAEVKRELDDQERLTSEFTLRHADELPQQVEANLAALDRLNTQLRLNGEYQLRAMERRERLEQELADDGSGGSPDRADRAHPPRRIRDRARHAQTAARRAAPPVHGRLPRRAAGQRGDQRHWNGRSPRRFPGNPTAGAVTRAGAARQVLAQLDSELASLRQQEGSAPPRDRRVRRPRRECASPAV